MTARLIMVAALDCMLNYGDCILKHNKLRWLFFVNKKIRWLHKNNKKELVSVFKILLLRHMSQKCILKQKSKRWLHLGANPAWWQKNKKGILKSRFFFEFGDCTWKHVFFYITLKHNFAQWLHFTVFPFSYSRFVLRLKPNYQ